jgi:hypothetical protein
MLAVDLLNVNSPLPYFRALSSQSFLAAQSYAGFVVLYAWLSNSLPRPPAKRAVGELVSVRYLRRFEQCPSLGIDQCLESVG